MAATVCKRLAEPNCIDHFAGEYMAGLLAAQGYGIQHDKAGADLWLLNSCTVKTPSEDTFNNDIRQAQGEGIPVVVAGCVAQVLHHVPRHAPAHE